MFCKIKKVYNKSSLSIRELFVFIANVLQYRSFRPLFHVLFFSLRFSNSIRIKNKVIEPTVIISFTNAEREPIPIA